MKFFTLIVTFFLVESLLHVHNIITTSYNKLLERFYNKHIALASVHGLDWSRVVGTPIDGETVSVCEGQQSSLIHTPFFDG